MKHNIFKFDKNLMLYERDFDLRMERFHQKCRELLPEGGSLVEFANGHNYFGFHKTETGWFYREWAPAADAVYLTGDFCGWDRRAY
ncbi:MAG: 1,4-alpha-glucan-branching enzyme, partial [Clostridia bacterium]|nr:1,4-alpha-glucan-branching enzyme [Clostridia bacterium]